jgi:aldehyde:ferredoxin oxidoreductase
VIAQTLLKELTPGIESLSSGNKLVFAAGLLTGHKLIGSGRMGAGAKSPLSGAYGESEVGGLFGTELRKRGGTPSLSKGVQHAPVYLWICDDVG